MNTKNYAINGDFGQVRLCRSIISPQLHTPFTFTRGGWHHCNELYHIKRNNGQPDYLIFFSISDGGCVKINDVFYEVPASSVVILPPNISHEYYTAPNSWWEFYWLYFFPEFSGIFDRITSEFGYVLELPRAIQMGKLLEKLLPERFLTDEISYEITASQVMSQILHMLLEDVYESTEKHQNKNNVVQNVLHEIEANYKSKLNIEELAEKHYLSIQHLIRIFKKDTGYTPYEYLKKYRLQKGCELLVSSNLSINEIAETVGFSNGNNFIYQFKKEYGVTPGDYRELYS